MTYQIENCKVQSKIAGQGTLSKYTRKFNIQEAEKFN